MEQIFDDQQYVFDSGDGTYFRVRLKPDGTAYANLSIRGSKVFDNIHIKGTFHKP